MRVGAASAIVEWFGAAYTRRAALESKATMKDKKLDLSLRMGTFVGVVALASGVATVAKGPQDATAGSLAVLAIVFGAAAAVGSYTTLKSLWLQDHHHTPR